MYCPTCGKKYTEEDAARDEGKSCAVKPEVFSGMCAEEIQEVADRLYTKEFSKNEKKILILIANLARILKRMT